MSVKKIIIRQADAKSARHPRVNPRNRARNVFLRNFFLTRLLRDACSSITGHLDTSHTEKEAIGNTHADAERLGSRYGAQSKQFGNDIIANHFSWRIMLCV